MRRGWVVTWVAATVGGGSAARAQAPGDWPAYGRDPGGMRHSPLTGIDRANVTRLAPTWTYRTGETGPGYATAKKTAFETTPLVVDGTMFLGTPLGRVIALDPETGKERWSYDPGIR